MNVDHEGINKEYYKSDFRGWDKNAEISYNNNEIRQKAKYQFFQYAYDFLVANWIDGDYLEFGCHKARTFRMSLSEARKKNRDKMRFYAFDSFMGMPESKGIDKFEGWEKGTLNTSEDTFDKIINDHGVYTDKVTKIKGFFNESLTPKLQKEFLQNNVKAAIIYIDSDLYESCVDVLNFTEPMMQTGTILCFDDWNMFKADHRMGEKKAFAEFKQKTGLHFEEFINIGWAGKSFIVIR